MDLDAPIAVQRHGYPILYPALGCTFLLEPMLPADAPAWTDVVARVGGWLGPRMKWSFMNALGFIEPFRSRDLSYLDRLPRVLNPEVPANTPEELKPIARRLHALKHGEFALACHGAGESWSASPWSIRAYCEVLDEQSYLVSTMFRITVPAASGVEELASFGDMLAGTMRLRWGSLGYTYSGWDIQHNAEVRQGMYAHSRRHLGFDLPVQATLIPAFHEALRSVNWMTYLGPALASRLPKALPSDVLRTATLPNGTVRIVAGESPQVGDINRLEVPRAYQDADFRVRPARAKGGFSFLQPWDEHSTSEWLCRFERIAPTIAS